MNNLTSLLKTLCIVGIAFANANALARPNKVIEAANSQLSLSVTSPSMTYHELDVSNYTGTPYFDSETGTLPGYTVDWKGQGEVLSLPNMYVQVSLHSVTGSLGYDGFLQDQYGNIVSPYQTVSAATITDVGFRIGKVVTTAPTAQLIPFVGYSTHKWVRTTPPPYGFEETYNHAVLEVGIMGQVALTPKLVGTVTASFGAMQDAKMQVAGGPELVLGNQGTRSLELAADYALDKHWHMSGAVGSVDFKYGRSPVKAGMYEPDSTTNTGYVSFGVGYHF